MPLKHLTETLLIVLLGVMVLLAGIAMDTLPLLPAGALPWAIAFGVALLYALLAYPTLKSNRAEYSFRVLHFLPAGMLLVWLIIQLIALKEPRALVVHHWYTWGWALFAVVVGFLLLIAFCLSVIRRRFPRIALLVLLLVPFAAFAFASEQYLHLDNKLSATVWQGDWWDLVGTGSFIAERPVVVTDSGANLDPSDNPAEEAWRRRLRALDERRREILEARRRSSSSSSVTVIAVNTSSVSSVARSSAFSSVPSSSVRSSSISSKTSSSVQGSSSSLVIAVIPGTDSSSSSVSSSSSQSSVLIGQVTPPPRLPSSGFGASSMVIVMLAGYTGVLHDRARRRRD